MFHVFKHHDERVTLHTHSVEGDDVLVLQVGEELGLSEEVRSAALARLFEGLREMPRHKDTCEYSERRYLQDSNIESMGVQSMNDA